MGDEGLQGTGGRRDFERGSLCSRRRLRESELETTKPRTAEKSGESIVEELGALGVNGGGWKWGETRRRIKQRGGLPSYRRDPAKILAEISLCTVLGPFRRVFRPLSSLSLSLFLFPFLCLSLTRVLRQLSLGHDGGTDRIFDIYSVSFILFGFDVVLFSLERRRGCLWLVETARWRWRN